MSSTGGTYKPTGTFPALEHFASLPDEDLSLTLHSKQSTAVSRRTAPQTSVSAPASSPTARSTLLRPARLSVSLFFTTTRPHGLTLHDHRVDTLPALAPDPPAPTPAPVVTTSRLRTTASARTDSPTAASRATKLTRTERAVCYETISDARF